MVSVLAETVREQTGCQTERSFESVSTTELRRLLKKRDMQEGQDTEWLGGCIS